MVPQIHKNSKKLAYFDDLDRTYIGKTKWLLHQRFKEHRNLDYPNRVSDHRLTTGYSVAIQNIEVLAKEQQCEEKWRRSFISSWEPPRWTGTGCPTSTISSFCTVTCPECIGLHASDTPCPALRGHLPYLTFSINNYPSAWSGSVVDKCAIYFNSLSPGRFQFNFR